eukprot:Hpha_TRINITY_DN16293_c2_g1::TRINITY_DN16293_c2_g1_i1::g.14367::m.14367
MANISEFPSCPADESTQYVLVESAAALPELVTPETPAPIAGGAAVDSSGQENDVPVAARPSHTISDCRSGRSYSGVDTPNTAPLPRSSTPPARRLSMTAEGASREMVAGRDEVTFVPFAMFREGNRIHSRSVGWHSDGDVVVLREEVSSSSDAEGKSQRKAWLTDTRRLECPIPEKLIEKKGLRDIPGTRGPKAKAKRRRWQRAFLVDDDDDEGQGPRPGRLTKTDFQELFTHRPKTAHSFHNEDGPVDKRWLPFCDVTMDKQERLLSRVAGAKKPKTESDVPRPPRPATALTGQQRLGWITKPVRLELSRANQRQYLVPELEERVQEYLRDLGEDRRPLVLEIEDSFHRMLFHAVCEFYCIDSQSHTAEDGVRYTVAELRERYTPEQALDTAPLSELLTNRRAQGDAGQRLKQRHRRRKRMG